MSRLVLVLCALPVTLGHLWAAPLAPAEFRPELRTSSYKPTKARDPLMRIGGPIVPGNKQSNAVAAPVNIAFRLEGILYHPTAPSALLNDKLIHLNKPVKVVVGGDEIVVNAVEITRDRVVVEAGGQKVELRLASVPVAGKSGQ